ncbi:type IV secretory system conjugative DNA transfer family protein [Eubacteriales bacterium OttesenSCG-928-N14]|nr:type IV secretory system conjugative DNA transfer family protein [Eubacteriales bacterium OttesenSCG-928-N14]
MTSKKNSISYDRYIYITLGAVFVIWAAVWSAPHINDGLPHYLFVIANDFNPLSLSWQSNTIICILVCIGVYSLALAVYFTIQGVYRRGEEYGSAVWGSPHEICKKYADSDFYSNRLLTENVRMSLDTRKTQRNSHVLCLGGSGSGKSRSYCLPQIYTAAAGAYNIICTDPKGELLYQSGELLVSKGYTVKVIDLINMRKSQCFNPFPYLRDDISVVRLVNNLFTSTSPANVSSSADPFWERAEKALLQALIYYLLYEAPPHEQNMPMIMAMIASSGASEEDEDYQSTLDILFERLAMEKPDHIAVKQYDVFRLASGRTAKSILISLAVRIEKWAIEDFAAICKHDDIDIRSFANEKQALFIILPDNDSSFGFFISMVLNTFMTELFYYADHIIHGPLPRHVHFLLDEYSSCRLGGGDTWERYLSVARSRNIGISIITQAISQLQTIHEKNWQSMIGNTDVILYLGGNEQVTHKTLSELIGKQSLLTNSYGETHGNSGSRSKNTQGLGRDLMTPDEIRSLDNDYALLLIRGEQPIRDLKIRVESHPYAKFTPNGGGKAYLHGSIKHARQWNDAVIDPSRNRILLSRSEVEAKYLNKPKNQSQS